MDNETVERIAVECGADLWHVEAETGRRAMCTDSVDLYQFAALIAEECAKLCEKMEDDSRAAWASMHPFPSDCAKAIRERFGSA